MKQAERQKSEKIACIGLVHGFYDVERCFASDCTGAGISFVTPGSKSLEFNQDVSVTCSAPVSLVMSFSLQL